MKLINRGLRKTRKSIAGIAGEEAGFTLVELSMVMLISVIMLAGMVAMITNAFDLFGTSKDLQAVTDSQRRVLGSMTRQIRNALFLVDAECDENTLTFYSDIDNDQGTAADVDNYAQAEKVSFYLEDKKVMMSVTEPDGTPAVPATIGSYVNSIKFYYFLAKELPELDPISPDPKSPINSYAGTEKNEEVGMIRIVLRMQKGDIQRSFYQDVALRILDRT
ncbi:MAG: hypothetical protein JXA49_04585 [Actinobacteria bacterium]|nr:hypothetical protein [Actinomycetota bacterium]